ncbi:MAG: hypothetical protein LBV01_03245 [Deltaproteobacteria bacterium]|nr:hypothetical protein [Deltaproteobacteria bacterium]
MLRNDSKVVRFRLNSFWAKFLIGFFIFFSGASGASGYAAHYYWKKYTAIQREQSELTEKLGEKRRELDRFEGIEKIKESLPRTAMTGVATVAPGPASPENAASAGADSGGATEAPGSGGARPAGTEPPAAGSGPAQPSSGTGGAADASPAQPGVQPGTQSGAAGASPDASSRAYHPAGINNAHIRSLGARNYRLMYELTNQERERESPREQFLSLSGKVSVAVASATGERREISSINGDSLRFVIKWGKKVDVTFSLPADMDPKNAATLLLTAEPDGLPAVTYSFPMPQPQ